VSACRTSWVLIKFHEWLQKFYSVYKTFWEPTELPECLQNFLPQWLQNFPSTYKTSWVLIKFNEWLQNFYCVFQTSWEPTELAEYLQNFPSTYKTSRVLIELMSLIELPKCVQSYLRAEKLHEYLWNLESLLSVR
jgi:hypothetical protein